MFTVNKQTKVYENPTCCRAIDEHKVFTKSSHYFDKDGFELTHVEREFYYVNGYTITDILNHTCCQQPWMTVKSDNFLLDHCIILHRCNFEGAAKEQLLFYKHQVPTLSQLLQCKQKWGLDLALDYFDGEDMYEVLHVEQDFNTLQECTAYKENIEKFVFAIDWEDAAKRLIARKDEWSSLIGFAQNDWKARFFGFPKAELTHKALVY